MDGFMSSGNGHFMGGRTGKVNFSSIFRPSNPFVDAAWGDTDVEQVLEENERLKRVIQILLGYGEA